MRLPEASLDRLPRLSCEANELSRINTPDGAIGGRAGARISEEKKIH